MPKISNKKVKKIYKKLLTFISKFDSWKKLAQSKIRDYKQGKVTEDELYEWMMENK